MTNETRAALVLLKAQLSASEEAMLRFGVLRDALTASASGGGIAAPTAEAERSLAAVRARAQALVDFLTQTESQSLADVIGRESDLHERLAVERILRAVTRRQEELRALVQTCGQLLQTSAAFVNYQLNVISGTVADDTYGRSQPVAGPSPGVRREIAMFDADV
jgi:hypothetical protein